jgi:hypothetical protein
MTRRKRSLIAEVRSAEYEQARILGDVRAVQTHTVGRRIANRLIGRALSRLFIKR